MSDIAKKTLPPGSWPGSKGGAKTADTTSTKGRPDEPRLAPSPPADIHAGDKNADDKETTTASDNFSGSGEYIHHDTKSQKDDNISEINGALSGPQQQDDENDQEEIKLKDNDQSTPVEKQESLAELAPEPEKDEAALENASEKPESNASEAGDKAGTETPASSSKLTEAAKQAFDNASENQPTEEARESFLRSAQGEREIPDRSKAAGSEKPLDEGQSQADVPEGVEKAASDVRGETSEAAAIGSKVDKSEAAPSVAASGAKETDNASRIASDDLRQEQAVSEQPEQSLATVQEGSETQEQQQQVTQEEVDQEDQLFRGSQQEQELPKEQQTEQQFEQGEGDGSTVAEHMDFSVLKNGKVNKAGNVVNGDGKVVGRVVSGILQYLVGKKVDENGDIWSDNGKVIGKAEPISDSEREDMLRESAPFESFPDATVDGNGMVVSNGEWVGKVTEGDVSVLRGKSVDPDGDILDKAGNVIGKAVRWEPEPEEEAEPEPEVDKSILAGKRVNKAGNVVDGAGVIFGRVVEGDVKRMVGRMCDKNGNVLSESGDILGKADVVPEGEREGSKEGPFAELVDCTVAKDGTVVTPSGDIVGRLTKGDAKVLFGRGVDEDGDVLDKNGNVIGKAERWEPEVAEKSKNPMSGRKVNREGNVVDADGNVVGKLTSGDLQKCAGKEIDDDGDVVDGKGTVIGHCSLLEDIPKEEEESVQDKEKRETAERDKKLAVQMSVCIEQCLDKIRPICKMITEKIDKAERTPEDERDEEQLVKEVRPLIEEGGRILTEAKGIIKGLDPDGRISANAKHKTAARDATPEEYHLADVLKDLTGDVTQCIENAKKKLEDMPHAKKELNPLWGLLNEPLFQILAAVGLLLSGVLNLVGRLLSGLGLGGLVDGLLGTLGINRVLAGLGLGSFSESLKSGKKKKGGLLGGILGG